ncbi:Radical SAM superfamily protein [Azotobacter beijerinckii]|uniref:Radical SAM superfamily protein n=1 Tax=Azotobacter beijerinckii TaxID=170623 RepID=A0A1H6U860_9GAMM|nr:Radical SAM superfamily protein [Azotobacter beijerinckii]
MRSEPLLDDDGQGGIIDAQGRRLRNLRVSLTSACNYACVYCVADGKRLHADRKALSLSRLLLAVEYLKVANDLRTLRITGGEPLISPLFDGFMAELGRLGFADVSLTTNGQLLSRKLPVLLAAGVERINVSLDTLDAGALRRIARGGDLAGVLEGIERALAAGVRVKINMVPLRGHNHEQVLPMLDYCLARGMELRFIELMRMGHLARDPRTFQRQFFGMAEILATISERSGRHGTALRDTGAWLFRCHRQRECAVLQPVQPRAAELHGMAAWLPVFQSESLPGGCARAAPRRGAGAYSRALRASAGGQAGRALLWRCDEHEADRWLSRSPCRCRHRAASASPAALAYAS